MSHGLRADRPSFFWQGLLIVLPVAVLACLGIVSLRQDQRLAEEEARRRAAELLRQLMVSASHGARVQLSQCARLATLYWASVYPTQVVNLIERPGDAVGKSIRAAGDQDLADWLRQHRTVDPAEFLFDVVSVTETGESIGMVQEYDAVPLPPAWLTQMPDDQRAAWDEAQRAAARNESADIQSRAWTRFLELQPSDPAQLNAQFALLQTRANTSTSPDRVDQFLGFASTNRLVRSESGLPLSAVAMAAALRALESKEFTAPLIEALRIHVFSAPSMLTPFLLREGLRRAEGGDQSSQDSVIALRRAWGNQEQLRDLLRRARERLTPPWRAGTNCWLITPTGEWFATFLAEEPGTDSASPPLEQAGTNRVMHLQFFPRLVLEQTLTTAIHEANLTIPSYFELQVEWAGMVLIPPKAAAPTARDAPIFASASTMLEAPSSLPPAGNRLDSSPADPALFAGPLPLTLRMALVDPPALYAQQRQRTILFGGLILAIALAAVAGFVRARRAFWREHQLGELKTNFVSSVSHELRAPIASVRLMAESLERGKIQDPGKQREYYRFIVQECRRLSSLISNVLDFSRIEQGRKQYDFEPTDVAALVQNTIDLMKHYAAEREISLVMDASDFVGEQTAGVGLVLGTRSGLASELVHPLIDGRAIQQALVNLLDNAIKHSPKGAAVRVGFQLGAGSVPVPARLANIQPASVPRAGRGAPSLRIWVDDQGGGIPAGEQARIFERFYRLGSELQRETQGVGIGLSIVKHIVEAHHGRVIVQSEVGQGSRFTLEIPHPPQASEPARGAQP